MHHEKKLLARWTAPLRQYESVRIGPGDDAAVLKPSPERLDRVCTVDAVVEGIHYTPETAPEDVVHKLFARNVSDLAAMGARPEFAVLSLAVHPSTHDEAYLDRFFLAVAHESERYTISLCGGDVTTLPMPGLCASLTLNGLRMSRPDALRSTAQAQDGLFVTGKLGNSYASGYHLRFEPRLEEGIFLFEHGYAGAMMDISDGLLNDLESLCSASHCGAMVDCAALPLRAGASCEQALNDGEDYELLIAVRPDQCEELQKCWPFETPLTPIGHLRENPGLCDAQGLRLEPHGWDPFRDADHA